MKVKMIEISFPCDVDLPDGFEQVLNSLVDMVCKKWESDNLGNIMWPAEHGNKVLWDEPNEPRFDSSIFAIDVSAREAHQSEIDRGRVKAKPE